MLAFVVRCVCFPDWTLSSLKAGTWLSTFMSPGSRVGPAQDWCLGKRKLSDRKRNQGGEERRWDKGLPGGVGVGWVGGRLRSTRTR